MFEPHVGPELSRQVVGLVSSLQDYVYNYNLDLPHHLHPAFTPRGDLPGLRREGGEAEPEGDGMYEILLLQQKIVLQVGDRLKLCWHRAQYTSHQPLLDLRRVLVHLDQSLAKLADLRLRREVSCLVRGLRPGQPAHLVDHTLHTLVHLGNHPQSSSLTTHLTHLATMERLVELCRRSADDLSSSNSSQSTLLLGLRAISSICWAVECVRGLEAGGGVDLVTRLLESGPGLEVKVEAAGVLAQLTSPAISDNHSVAGLRDNLDSVILNLTRLAGLRCGEDAFLLTAAALANLSLMEPAASLESMLANSTSSLLCTRVTSDPSTSVFARDQVVTVLASLTVSPRARASILREGGLQFLTTHFQLSLEGLEPGSPAASALERVLKKSCIALCRLCLGREESLELEARGGVSRALLLATSPAARHHSHSLLLACLALLRRVQPHLNNNNHITNITGLSNSSLVQSFRELAYQQTSYV